MFGKIHGLRVRVGFARTIRGQYPKLVILKGKYFFINKLIFYLIEKYFLLINFINDK